MLSRIVISLFSGHLRQPLLDGILNKARCGACLFALMVRWQSQFQYFGEPSTALLAHPDSGLSWSQGRCTGQSCHGFLELRRPVAADIPASPLSKEAMRSSGG
jgi:hypothetical protein